MYHAGGFTGRQKVNIMNFCPSGRFPSIRESPIRSLPAGIWVFLTVRHIYRIVELCERRMWLEVRPYDKPSQVVLWRRLLYGKRVRKVGIDLSPVDSVRLCGVSRLSRSTNHLCLDWTLLSDLILILSDRFGDLAIMSMMATMMILTISLSS